jgi:hypothetical protein
VLATQTLALRIYTNKMGLLVPAIRLIAMMVNAILMTNNASISGVQVHLLLMMCVMTRQISLETDTVTVAVPSALVQPIM